MNRAPTREKAHRPDGIVGTINRAPTREKAGRAGGMEGSGLFGIGGAAVRRVRSVIVGVIVGIVFRIIASGGRGRIGERDRFASHVVPGLVFVHEGIFLFYVGEGVQHELGDVGERGG
jgi:hypothetical protein